MLCIILISRTLRYSIIILRNLNNYEGNSHVQEEKRRRAGAPKNGSLGARTGVATCASSWGFGLTKEKKTPSQKTLKSPATSGEVAVPRWIKFLGQEAGHVEGSRKAGGSGRKLTDACERSLRILSNIRRSRSPSSPNDELKVAESTRISTMGTFLNLHLGAGGLPQTVWLRGRSGRGRDLKDEYWMKWRRDVVLRSTEAEEGRRACHGRFRFGVCFRYIDFSQMVTNDLTKYLDYEVSMILFG